MAFGKTLNYNLLETILCKNNVVLTRFLWCSLWKAAVTTITVGQHRLETAFGVWWTWCIQCQIVLSCGLAVELCNTIY